MTVIYEMSEKTILITGANGYFGGIACEYFARQGWNVLKAGRQNSCDMPFNLDAPEDIANYRLKQHVDLVIHAAAANEVLCSKDPYNSVFYNVVGTKALLDFCVNNNIDKIVYISTFHVYGNPKGVVDELVLPIPENDYGLSHLQAEEYIQMYNRNGRIKGMVVRPSNLFGVPVDLGNCKRWSLVTLGFVLDAVQKSAIRLKTQGMQKRNFVSSIDICSFIEKAFPILEQFPVVNLAGKETISIRNFAQLVSTVAKKEYNLNIELIVPEIDGLVPIVNEFKYDSCYSNAIWQPSENIEKYLIGLFCALLNKNDFITPK